MLLSKEDVALYAFRTGRIYEHVCDVCKERLIRVGEICVVLKWQKRKDGTEAMRGAIPVKVMCMDCDKAKHPERYKEKDIKVKGAGRGAKTVDKATAKELKINPAIRRFVLKTLTKDKDGLTKIILLQRIFGRRKFRELKKKEVRATVRGMQKLKIIRRHNGKIVITPEKKQKNKKRKISK